MKYLHHIPQHFYFLMHLIYCNLQPDMATGYLVCHICSGYFTSLQGHNFQTIIKQISLHHYINE